MSADALVVNRVLYPVTALGPGRRLGVWLQGCPLACAGCMSRDTWDPAMGEVVPVAELAALWDTVQADGASGLTVTGGEPLTQADALAAFVRHVAGNRIGPGGEADILLFTGYELDELDRRRQAALEGVDVLVTGRFRAAEPTRLVLRGSANQVMHLRTPLGEMRYRELAAAETDTPAMQAFVEGDRLLLSGVPQRGTLAVLERTLRAGGVQLDGVSWRP
ncbi:radical activating enzyme [Catellatospora sp. IY07-71]|uniref:4Fe-4S single cluster domain-containing protein n=1 Tax=Catellatospora sp. IY07-71 TaxID=2728827 RepID=UPI001BB44CEC|nr:4Fe-4S single cluster domain-containing protein [Catellatospora sp. IY07-71]BCJ70790.1 radical activating enzyme [Catellatospora sp. IY07-71]